MTLTSSQVAPTNDTPHNQGDNGGLISIQIKFVRQGLRSLGLVVLTDFLICASLITGLGAGNDYFLGNYTKPDDLIVKYNHIFPRRKIRTLHSRWKL